MPPPIGVRIKLDGKERELRFTNRALVIFERTTNLTIAEAMLHAERGSLSVFNSLLWAGLLDQDKDLELDDLLDMVDTHDISALSDKIAEAINLALPDEGDAGEEGKGEAQS